NQLTFKFFKNEKVRITRAYYHRLIFRIKSRSSKRKHYFGNSNKRKGYTVLNAGEPITIYKYQHLSHSPKEAEKYAPKYYFTTSNSNVLQELRKMNLKKAFQDDHPFHDALDAQFKDDT